jgi:predicted metal-binding membrane protein
MQRSLTDRILTRDRWIVVTALVLAVVLSGSYILSGAGTGMSALDMSIDTGPAGALIGGMPDMVYAMTWTPSYAITIFLMWLLMMAAMMVPSAAPTILLYGALHRDRGIWGYFGFTAGYLLVWAGFSLVATLVQGALAATGLVSAMYMNLAAPYLAAAVLLLAGFYQLTPIKAACLNHCRGPVEALVRHRRTGRAASLRMGMIHGSYCVGCCWAIMALLFVGGVMNIWWILGIAVYVALEKLAPGGRMLSRVMSGVLILGGVAVFVRTVSGA